ncbi:hypothetical protein L5515_018982 [Caenorhabditis briggsae]|uniref:Uncharacterized protein n=1 Tax=Caenorhabditis briggsae TaxID=6238 RepID=A0AAE9FH68_CAEBR|nr:hypothetical protein L5515_018982 [Caenorhabditis briggsae]
MSDQPNNVESSDDDDIRIGPLPNQMRSLSRVKEHNEKKNNFIRSNQQWDIKNYQECFDDILKNVLYLPAKHGEMFVRALTEFLRQYGYVLCGDGSAASSVSCNIKHQKTAVTLSEFLLRGWIAQKKALDNCYADFLSRDRKLMRNQEGKRLFKCKMEKNELDLYVLKECVPEDERISMKLDVVKTDVSKHKAKKRKLDTAVKKLKKPAVAHKTNEISEPFHRFTPFPSKGGFTNCEYSHIQK